MSPRIMRTLAAPIGAASVLAASAVLAGGPAASAASPAGLGGKWRTAVELPGVGSLNKGGNSGLLALSCGSPGNCAAGGYYQQSGGQRQTFVADERKGSWHSAVQVPGIGALNKGGDARVLAISCCSRSTRATAPPLPSSPCRAPAGCLAGGFYHDGSGRQEPFVLARR